MSKRQGYQQGDVLILAANALPENAKPVKAGARGYVLAEGEVTGHAHVITATPDVEMYEDSNGTLWLKVGVESEVTHEEHHAQTVAPGIYEVRRVVEVDPFADEIRAVAD